MPKAVVNAEHQETHKLKTAPADPNEPGDEQGFVTLRRMSYGEYLHRRSFTSDMRVRGGGKKDDFEGILQLMNEKVTQYEFATCIVDHNLTDDGGEKLDFGKVSTIKRLDPRIGEEISMLIDKMNKLDEEGEEELGN